ncbi:MAG: ferredoxin reductase [Chloroflexi bacterium]|nr:ferredoxin reductase [Chloroflexota bacterium]
MVAPARLAWQTAVVEKVKVETPRVKSFTFRLPDWQPFRPGQHFDVRLTAPDGYQAQRSYSAASPPEDTGTVELTVELMPGGEVSPYFHDIVAPGDSVELRGPIGGPFTWTSAVGGPLLLVGGGSGIVPLMSMLRHRRRTGSNVPASLLYSARSWDEVIYRDELVEYAMNDRSFHFLLTLTRQQPPGWKGPARRIDPEIIGTAVGGIGTPAHAYVCGSEGFVETAASLLVESGVPPDVVRTERFGPTGT